MKKVLAMSVLVLAVAFVAACGSKQTKEEPMPAAPAVAPAPVAVQAPVAPPVDPNVAAAQQKYQDGLKQFNNGNYKGALSTWQACLKLDPNNEDCQAGVRAANDMITAKTAKHK